MKQKYPEWAVPGLLAIQRDDGVRHNPARQCRLDRCGLVDTGIVGSHGQLPVHHQDAAAAAGGAVHHQPKRSRLWGNIGPVGVPPVPIDSIKLQDKTLKLAFVIPAQGPVSMDLTAAGPDSLAGKMTGPHGSQDVSARKSSSVSWAMAQADRADDVNPRPRWYVLLAVWSIPALLNMMTWLTFSRLGGRPLTIWQALVGETPAWLLWAALTPVIFALGRRFPVERGLSPGYLAVHGAAIVGASLAHAAATTAGILLAGVAASMGRPLPLIFANMLAQNIPFTAVMYAGLLGVRHGLVSAARMRREERVSTLLRSQLAEAQLGALRAQLRPHFCSTASMRCRRWCGTRRPTPRWTRST